MTLGAGTGRRIAGVFVLLLLMACVLPYRVAVFGLPDDASLAAAAGFDHRTAVLGIAAALALAGLWGAWRPLLAAPVRATVHDLPDLDTAFLLMVAAFLLVAALLFGNGDATYNEIYYFTDRMGLMDLGKLPYRDFLFNYGPLLIWTPWAVHRLLPDHWLLAYLITDIGFLLLSLLLIRGLVRALPVPPGARGLIFLALALFWLPLTYASGLHYCGIRFVAPVVLAFAARRLRGARLTRLWLQTLGSVLVAAALSFEIGLVMAVFCIGALLFLACAERRWPPLLALAGLLSALATIVALLPDWFTAPLTANFSGREFPLVPNVFLLFFLFSHAVAALLCLPPLLRAGATGRFALPDAELGLCFVAVIGILLIPGAVGRADFAHIFAFGFGTVLVALCWAANGPRPLRLFVYAGVAIELVAMNHWLFLAPALPALAGGPLAGKTAVPAPDKAATGRAIAAAWPGAYDPFFVASPAAGIETGFYTGSNDVVGAFATARKRAELRAAPVYLISTKLKPTAVGKPNALLDYERVVFAYVVKWPFPIPFRPRRTADALTGFINAAVANCQPVGRLDDVVICRNREVR
ncbi:MAG: hypothetical protein DCF31_09020 [Alphaproteobacteria bacterium]|nr:MAG: hypothetical protein DCF31_09020 [Alphaproteobacteria bacterium]